eukprot:g1433.t1
MRSSTQNEGEEGGKKFGLVKAAGLRASKYAALQGKRRRTSAAATALFGNDSMSVAETAGAAAPPKMRPSKKRQAEVDKIHAAALAQDRTVFEYDNVIEKEKNVAAMHAAPQEGSKYIAGLKMQAERRKREREIAFNRLQRKKAEDERELYGDKESFVSQAYRKHLESERKWEKDREKEEGAAVSVVSGGMAGFYKGLIETEQDAPPGQGVLNSAELSGDASDVYSAAKTENTGGTGITNSASKDERAKLDGQLPGSQLPGSQLPVSLAPSQAYSSREQGIEGSNPSLHHPSNDPREASYGEETRNRAKALQRRIAEARARYFERRETLRKRL